MRIKPSDLTVLTMSNRGVFPEQELLNIINSVGAHIAAHGTSAKPIWGYLMQTQINGIVDYIRSIQVQ
jgi:hypothetical protein